MFLKLQQLKRISSAGISISRVVAIAFFLLLVCDDIATAQGYNTGYPTPSYQKNIQTYSARPDASNTLPISERPNKVPYSSANTALASNTSPQRKVDSYIERSRQEFQEFKRSSSSNNLRFSERTNTSQKPFYVPPTQRKNWMNRAVEQRDQRLQRPDAMSGNPPMHQMNTGSPLQVRQKPSYQPQNQYVESAKPAWKKQGASDQPMNTTQIVQDVTQHRAQQPQIDYGYRQDPYQQRQSQPQQQMPPQTDMYGGQFHQMRPGYAPPVAMHPAYAPMLQPSRQLPSQPVLMPSKEGQGRHEFYRDAQGRVKKVQSLDHIPKHAQLSIKKYEYETEDVKFVEYGESDEDFDTRYALALSVGTLGAGGDLMAHISPRWVLRAGANAFSHSMSESYDDVDYDLDLDLSNLGVVAEWHPFKSGFNMSAGIYWNGNEATLISDPSSTYDLGGTIYTASEVGTLNGKASFDDFAPYVGVGFDSTFYDNGILGTGLSFNSRLGVLFSGSADIAFTSNGTAANDPTFQASLAAEEAKIEEDIAGADIYPVFSMGLTYKF